MKKNYIRLHNKETGTFYLFKKSKRMTNNKVVITAKKFDKKLRKRALFSEIKDK